MDRGAWWATAHRVTKSWIQLKQLNTGTYCILRAREGSTETSVDSGEGGRDAQPLKGEDTQFWKSGEKVEEPKKGEEKLGN